MSKLFPYGVKGPSELPEVADKILNEFFEIAKASGVQAFVTYGLCLGFVRDGGYIVGDNDLDVGVVIGDAGSRKKMHEMFIEHGFVVKQAFPGPGFNTHYIKNSILLDVFPRAGTGFYKEFSMVEYKGVKYPVPHPVDEYLSHCYRDWHKKEEEDGKIGV